jgi:lysozyme family protein
VPSLTQSNEDRWSAAAVRPSQAKSFTSVAKRLVAGKSRYQGLEAATGVPWFVISVIHEREASQRWDRSIAQGDPWNRVSVHTPRGRGPFRSFEDAAVDALVNCAPFAAKWTDFSAGGTLTLLEHYNGLGYYKRGLPSPYIWAGTNQYSRGKYTSDGKFDPNWMTRFRSGPRCHFYPRQTRKIRHPTVKLSLRTGRTMTTQTKLTSFLQSRRMPQDKPHRSMCRSRPRNTT